MRFESPLFLLLLLLTPLLMVGSNGLFLIRRRLPRRKDVLAFASPVALAQLGETPRLRRRPIIINTLRVGAYCCFVIALARPQAGIRFSEIEESGRDIMIALDTSGSMNALDFSLDGKRTDRLSALKHVVSDFIGERTGDRMGLIVFGTDVFTQAPLTTDQNVLKDFVKSLEIGMVGEGTALGDGLAIAVKRLKSIPGSSKVIVLVSDGAKTSGNIEPKQAAEIAAKEGIKVYSIGIGSDKPAPYRVQGFFGESRLEYRPSDLDEKTLKEIASLTGGKYYNAQQTDGFVDIMHEISQLEQRVDKSFEYIDYDERYLPFVLVGLVLLLSHELLLATRFITVP
ncbi:MAG: VWA domain-containing protein [Bdellovibrionota bacterium]